MTDGFDFNALLAQAQQMQDQLAANQEHAAATFVEGTAGGGLVKITVSGAMEFTKVVISPEAIDAADPEMLEDLILAALHDACARVMEIQQQAVGGLGLGAVDFGGLSGMLEQG